MADVLRLLGENAAMLTKGSYYPGRWGEAPPLEDDRTGDEIAADIILRAGLTVGGESE